MMQNIQIDATDAFFKKLLEALHFHLDAAFRLGLAYPDAMERACAEVLARIRADSGEGNLSLADGDASAKFTEDDVRVFTYGLVIGGFFERSGLSFSQKWCEKNLQ